MENYLMAIFSELIGTAVLILLGNGVCSAVLYSKMFSNNSCKWITIVFGWGLAVFIGATISFVMGGFGHLNPAISIFDAILASKNNLNVENIYSIGSKLINISYDSSIALTFFLFFTMQILGALLGQIILNFMNTKFILDKENSLLVIKNAHFPSPVYDNRKNKATIFNFSYELIGSMILIGMIAAFNHLSLSNINTGNESTNIGDGPFAALPVSLVVMSIGFSLGGATGYALNPARDIGPRIIFATYIKFMRKDEWNKELIQWYYSWIPFIAPILAGILIGCFCLI